MNDKTKQGISAADKTVAKKAFPPKPQPEVRIDLFPKQEKPPPKPTFFPTTARALGPNVSLPVQQVYNINLPGPAGGHVEMNNVYEMILPASGRLSASTLGERLQLYDYIRQVLIHVCEGESIDINTRGDANNILSYLKLLELNPTYYNALFNNPYRGLPYGLLIYRCCFPIQLSTITNNTQCAKNPIALNLRIYALSCAAYENYMLRNMCYLHYDVWRELIYYKLIRQNILQTKMSPNFPIMDAYFISNDWKIDFLKLKTNCMTQRECMTLEFKAFERNFLKEQGKKIPQELLPSNEINPELKQSGSSLIIVTESYHYNMYQWACRTFESKGVVKRMIQTGFHHEQTWKSIYFQIIYALCAMQSAGIYMKNMSIEDNIYIKDLRVKGIPTGYWKYVVNNIPYYIPNYGYIVIIDSNFKNVNCIDALDTETKPVYRIYATNGIGAPITQEELQKGTYQNYRNIISTNAFTQAQMKNGVFRPPDNIVSLLENMMMFQDKSLPTILRTFFKSFLNPKIGTIIDERAVLIDATGPLSVGDIVAETNDVSSRWAMVEEVNGETITILTRDTNTSPFISKKVRYEALKVPSETTFLPSFTSGGIEFSPANLLETYRVTG